MRRAHQDPWRSSVCGRQGVGARWGSRCAWARSSGLTQQQVMCAPSGSSGYARARRNDQQDVRRARVIDTPIGGDSAMASQPQPLAQSLACYGELSPRSRLLITPMRASRPSRTEDRGVAAQAGLSAIPVQRCLNAWTLLTKHAALVASARRRKPPRWINPFEPWVFRAASPDLGPTSPAQRSGGSTLAGGDGPMSWPPATSGSVKSDRGSAPWNPKIVRSRSTFLTPDTRVGTC